MKDYEDDPYEGTYTPPYWQCSECGYENHTKPMPKNRDKFYLEGKARICPHCKSEALVPIGW